MLEYKYIVKHWQLALTARGWECFVCVSCVTAHSRVGLRSCFSAAVATFRTQHSLYCSSSCYQTQALHGGTPHAL